MPAGIYSVNHETLDEIPDGATVAVPNDASNTARCYPLLEKVGWIALCFLTGLWKILVHVKKSAST